MPFYTRRTGDRSLTFFLTHIPKTGGTALSVHLQSLGFRESFGIENHVVRPYMRCPPQHYDYEIVERLFEIAELPSFAVVRHPFERLASDYRWAMTKSPMAGTGMSFDGWVAEMFARYARDPYTLANHIRPQHHFVGPKIRRVFRYERGLTAIFREIVRALGPGLDAGAPVPLINASDGPVPIVEAAPACRDAIFRFYEEDFRRFGYPRDPSAPIPGLPPGEPSPTP